MDKLKREDESPISDGINNNTYKLLFGDYKNLPQDESGTYDNMIAWATISKFTRLQEKKIFTKLLNVVFKNISDIDLNNIKYNEETKQYEYKNKDLTITFDKLSSHFGNADLKKELTSNERYRKCHSRAITISPSIKGSRIVTGYITIGNNKFLHSVIELEHKGEVFVLDWTRNMQISKKQYVELTNFVELASFEGSKVIDDAEIISGNLDIGVKTYVVFWDELIRDMKKNPQIFQPTEEGLKNTEKFRNQEHENTKKTK